MRFNRDIQLIWDLKVSVPSYMDSKFLTKIDKILHKLLKEEVAYSIEGGSSLLYITLPHQITM